MEEEQSQKKKLMFREKVIDGLRAYLKANKYVEVTTPILLPTVSTEPNLEVFETELRDDQGSKKRMFLPTSPEYAMKKLLSKGSGSIFQITKSFRNEEGDSPIHSPEFTILEWYEVGGDYMSVVSEMEALLRYLLKRLGREVETLTYQGKKYSLKSPWEKISVREAFERFADVGEEEMLDEGKLKKTAEKRGYQVAEETSWEEVWNQILANEIEPRLGKEGPTVLYDYPIKQGAYAKKSKDPRYAERAEVYLAGVELANIYSELADAKEQRKRCEEDLAERKRLGKIEYPMDEEFIEALERGLPECGGVAMGVDRLVMLLDNESSLMI